MPTANLQDILMITFDALRYDVAVQAWERWQTPYLRGLIPAGWEQRHSPGNFTFAAHAAYFAGFWPTPLQPGKDRRPFTLQFPGMRPTLAETMVLHGPHIIEGLRRVDYQTICIGGVGFFNPSTPLGSLFPSYFEQSYWQPEFSVTNYSSTAAQVRMACQTLESADRERPVMLFLNVSATHAPTVDYVAGAKAESCDTQAAALAYVDRCLPALFAAIQKRKRVGVAYLMSDHGTLFGEDGWVGHRVSHPLVWNIPYTEYHWEPQS
ncbi:MAG: STM4013/SEN3800 family hydrolase [Pirellulales bacterium]|nr:STM4013/SEN3800 family hydrolase [Pirellulales bacterium]